MDLLEQTLREIALAPLTKITLHCSYCGAEFEGLDIPKAAFCLKCGFVTQKDEFKPKVNGK